MQIVRQSLYKLNTKIGQRHFPIFRVFRRCRKQVLTKDFFRKNRVYNFEVLTVEQHEFASSRTEHVLQSTIRACGVPCDYTKGWKWQPLLRVAAD